MNLWFIFWMAFRSSIDPFDYGGSSEENGFMKLLGDVSTTIEEKRGRSQAGCDCQLRVSLRAAWTLHTIYEYFVFFFFSPFQSEYVDLGPSTYPRYVKNVTCDEHKRCYQSRSKGYQCHPIHYKVSFGINFSSFRKRKKPFSLVGCVNRYSFSGERNKIAE